MSSWVFILCISFLLQAGHCLGVGFPSFNSTHVPFSSLVRGLAGASATPLHYSCNDFIHPCLSCCYFWVCGLKRLPCQFLVLFLLLVFIAQHSYWPVHLTPRASSAFFILQASLTRFILWASLAHFIISYLFHSHELLLNHLGFPGPITTSFAFRFIGLQTDLIYQFLSLGSFGPFLLSFYFLRFSWAYYFILQGFLDPFAFSRATYYFVGLWIIIPAILAQWSLLCCFLSPPFSYCWASSTIGPFCQKMGINILKSIVFIQPF